MSYFQLWSRHKGQILPMAAFVAWLWVFPLFGALQAALPVKEATLYGFNIAFLTGLIMSFFAVGLSGGTPFLRRLGRRSGGSNALIMAALLLYALLVKPAALEGPLPLLGTFPIFALAFAMGTFTALYFAFWGAGLAALPTRIRGGYMGSMLATASLFSMALSLVALASVTLAAFASGLLLLLPALSPAARTAAPVALPAREREAQPGCHPLRKFWLPFTLVLLSFYILSWVVHQVIFTAAREQHLLAPFWGQLAYGLAALSGGYILDRLEEVEFLAVAGLILMGGTFFFLPLAVDYRLFLPLQVFLEGSYGLIDLFIWVCIAYAAAYFRRDPVRYYGRGLFLNVLFVLSGLFLQGAFQDLSSELSTYRLSILAGALLFCGVFPALLLRRIMPSQRLVLPMEYGQIAGSPALDRIIAEESLTVREAEVLACILSGMDNTAIQDRLGVTKNTLKSHIKHIYTKMDVKNRADLLVRINRRSHDRSQRDAY